MLALSPRWCQTVPPARTLLRLPCSHAAPELSWGFVCIPPAHSCSPSRRVAVRLSTSEASSHQCRHPDGCPPHHTFQSILTGLRVLSLAASSPPSAPWVKRGECVSRPLPRAPERTTKKHRLPVHASQQVLRDRSRVSSAATKRDSSIEENALLYRHPEQRDVRSDTQHGGGNVVPLLLVRLA
jgi:hypothetical protein